MIKVWAWFYQGRWMWSVFDGHLWHSAAGLDGRLRGSDFQYCPIGSK